MKSYEYYNKFTKTNETTSDPLVANNIGYYSQKPVVEKENGKVVKSYIPSHVKVEGNIDQGFHKGR